MKLGEISLETLRRALDVYVEIAYPGGAAHRPLPLKLEGATSVAELLPQFLDETRQSGGNRTHRYALRLGNSRYPFMKFVLQENLLEGEYTFCADTHDQIEVKATAPDYREWLELRNYNSRVKDEIEARWEREKLPSPAALRDAVERWLEEHPRPHPTGKNQQILVVDDEREVADALRIFLEAQGYSVRVVHDGLAALQEIERSLPRLVLLDYDLPQLDGLRICREIQEAEDTKRIPVLVTTASNADLSLTEIVAGFLQKPFKLDLLLQFVTSLLPPEGFSPPPGG